MKMKQNYIVLGIASLVFIASVISLLMLPDTIPVHWNIEGEIDGYGSKYLCLLIGVLGLGVYFGMNFTKRIDPLEDKIDEKIESYFLMRDIMTVLLSGLGVVLLAGVFVPNFNLAGAMNIVLGLGFVALGNYMPRVPHNYFLGVKTPWALADENNWKKTQRFSGYAFCINGALMSISGVLNLSWGMIVSISLLLILTLATYVYSWYIYKHSN